MGSSRALPSSRRLRAAVLGGVLAASLPMPSGFAQEPAPDPAAQPSGTPTDPQATTPETTTPPEAQEFYERGQALYEDGRYREAIVELERAYALDPSGTILLYNIGLIHEKLGEIDPALAYYARYLAHDLAPDERSRVEGIVRRLEGARTQVHATDPSPSAPAPGAPPREPRTPARAYGRADTLFFLVGGAAVAAAAVGGIFGVLAIGNDADAEGVVSNGSADLQRRDALAATADRQALVADVALGGALVFGATAALLYFLREAEPTP